MNKSIIFAPQYLGVGESGLRDSPKKLRRYVKPDFIVMNSISKIDNNFKNPRVKNIDQIIEYTENLSEIVIKEYDTGKLPIIVGGDHSIALATVSAVASKVENLGVVWIDAHGDMNTDKTTPSGNIHGMILAALQGYGHTALVNACKQGGHIKTENIVVYGVRDLDCEEQITMDKINIRYYTYDEIERRGIKETINETIAYLLTKTKNIHISFDLDAFDPTIISGVSTPVSGGFNPNEALEILNPLFNFFNVTSFDIVEFNPKHDKNNKTRDFVLDIIKYI